MNINDLANSFSILLLYNLIPLINPTVHLSSLYSKHQILQKSTQYQYKIPIIVPFLIKNGTEAQKSQACSPTHPRAAQKPAKKSREKGLREPFLEIRTLPYAYLIKTLRITSNRNIRRRKLHVQSHFRPNRGQLSQSHVLQRISCRLFNRKSRRIRAFYRRRYSIRQICGIHVAFRHLGGTFGALSHKFGFKCEHQNTQMWGTYMGDNKFPI